MKTSLFRSLTLLAALGMALLTATPSFGQAFSGTGTAASTNSYYVISPTSGVGIPVVTFFDATLTTSEISNQVARVRFWTPSAEIGISGATTASATTITAPTNGLVAGDVLVFWKQSPESFQRLTVSSLSGSTITVNETITAAQTITSPSRDKLFKMALRGWVFGGSSLLGTAGYKDRITVNSPDSPIFVGKAGVPNLIEAMGTNSPVLNAVAGRHIPAAK